MFDNTKLITRGIDHYIPVEMQLFIWDRVLTMPIEKDYLQVFDLTVENDIQVVKHSQEVPAYETEYFLVGIKPIEAKIFVIDNTNYSTMLLAEEY